MGGIKDPGRKAFHFLGGLFLLAAYHALGPPQAFGLFGALFIAILMFDIARLSIPAFNRTIMGLLGGVMRPGEARTISGSPAHVLGAGLTLYFFDPAVASAAVLFLACGDVAATTVGERWGSPRVRGKSLEGTAAFTAAALLAGLAVFALAGDPAPGVILAGAAAAALAEVFTPRPLNDNLSIPLVSAAVMSLAQRLSG